MKTIKTIIVIAICFFASTNTFAFVDGDLDTTFGTSGKVFTQFNPHGPRPGTDITVQPDGKIVVVSGALASFLESGLNISRYNPNGTLDTTFGNGGKITTFLGGRPQDYNSVLIEPDGNIIVAGNSSRQIGPPDQTVYNFRVARFSPSGSVLMSAGLPFEVVGGMLVNDVALTTDNKILAVGINFSNVYLVRFNSNGSLDTSFDGDGIVTFGATVVSAVASQTDGKVLVAGQVGNNWLVLRFNANGTPDTSFDGDGVFNAPVGSGASTAKEMLVKSDGKILTVGAVAAPAMTALVQLNTDGSFDNTFDGDGRVFTNVPSTNGGLDVEIQRDGKIVAFSGGGSTFGLSRYLSNGALDTTFSGDGVATETVSTNPNAIALQPDGKIVASGNTMNGSFGDSFAVARFQAKVGTGFDFDGDSKTDISIFRPSNGQWWFSRSSDGGNNALQFGVSTDKIVPADFDGDGKTDIAVYRPSTGVWYLLQSTAGFAAYRWGIAEDIPVPADYDADGKADLAVWRPSNRTWYILQSTNNQASATQFGLSGDVVLPKANFDGDGRADIAVFRPSNGTFYWLASASSNQFKQVQFGLTGDIPTIGDFNGDGKDDLVVYRPSTGVWHQNLSMPSGDYVYTNTRFGLNGDEPVAADYDGDGKTDIAVRRGNMWHILKSSQGYSISTFGNASDSAIPALANP